MRHDFARLLHSHMRDDPRIWLLTNDLGFGVFDQIMKDYPDRTVNVGAAEQLCVGAAVGLAEEGLIPVCYTITPFWWRAAEWIRNYLAHEGAAVKLVGAGRDKDYAKENGFSHDARDLWQLFDLLKVQQSHPHDVEYLEHWMPTFLFNGLPSYLNLKR